jgi:hypothetical protein
MIKQESKNITNMNKWQVNSIKQFYEISKGR